MFETMMQDLRYTVRTLRKTPTFAVVAMLVIALGSGAVTTIFSGANALLLRPLPGSVRPDRMVNIGRSIPNQHSSLTPSYPFYLNLRDEARTMQGIAAWSAVALTVSTGAQGTTAFGNVVSANFFSVIGAKPQLGRFFTPDEDKNPGANSLVVLSDGFWHRYFGGDASIVGRSVLLNGAPYTVIGVAPAGFNGMFPIVRTDAWVPISMAPGLTGDRHGLTSRGSGWLEVFGRMKDGVTIDQAHADLVRVATAHLSEDPGDFKEFTGIQMSRVTGFPADASAAILAFVGLLLLISALVLVIASVNVAGMLLARATARRREMAIRIAIGAGRGRLIRQMLTESLVLFLGGAVGGLVIAVFATRLFSRIQVPADVSISANLSPDYRVFLFALAVALVTGVIFGLAPALEATRADVNAGLRSDSAGSGTRRTRLRNALVVGQLAISLLLLMSAGLFVRALGRGRQVSPGFDVTHVATAQINASTSGYTEERGQLLYQSIREKLQRVPGVTSVSVVRFTPLSGSSSGTRIRVIGSAAKTSDRDDGMTSVNFSTVGPDYFNVVRMPLVEGRGFLPTDLPTAPHVAVVNQEFAKQYWPGSSAIGKTFEFDSATVTIVGVAHDAKYSTLNEPLRPFMYLTLSQDWNPAATFMVRTTGDPSALAPAIRNAFHEADPILPVPELITLELATSIGLLPQRIAASVTGVMGVLGMILAVVGLYGVVSFTVGQRTREIGVRMALGADRANVLKLIVNDGMRLVVIGIGVGIVLAVAMTRVMAKFLFGVSPLDPLVFACIPLGLAAAALIASYLPARRAAATNPLEALRG